MRLDELDRVYLGLLRDYLEFIQRWLRGYLEVIYSSHNELQTNQGIQRTSDSMRNSPTMMQLLWLHEAERVVSDAICRPDDTQGNPDDKLSNRPKSLGK